MILSSKYSIERSANRKMESCTVVQLKNLKDLKNPLKYLVYRTRDTLCSMFTIHGGLKR